MHTDSLIHCILSLQIFMRMHGFAQDYYNRQWHRVFEQAPNSSGELWRTGHVSGLLLEWDVQNWFDKSHKEQYMVHKR